MKKPRVLVIGLGEFGSAIADAVWESGAELIVLDRSDEAIAALRSRSSAAYVGEGSNAKTLDAVGAKDVDVAVVSYGEDFEAQVLAVASLVRLGIKSIVARAASERQAEILTRLGATRVVRVEREMGSRVGLDITGRGA